MDCVLWPYIATILQQRETSTPRGVIFLYFAHCETKLKAADSSPAYDGHLRIADTDS